MSPRINDVADRFLPYVLPEGTTLGLDRVEDDEPGVAGNARLTGSIAAALFVVLAIEGVTILRIHSLISAHVFFGMLLVPLVVAKSGSTLYRFAHYYRGTPAYVRKGPPPVVLRLLGPFVVLLSLAVLGTGIGLVAVGPGHGWLLLAHKATFVLWFGATTLHVLAHLLETPALALADWRAGRGTNPVRGVLARRSLLVGSLVAGVALGWISLSWVGAWHHVVHH